MAPRLLLALTCASLWPCVSPPRAGFWTSRAACRTARWRRQRRTRRAPRPRRPRARPARHRLLRVRLWTAARRRASCTARATARRCRTPPRSRSTSRRCVAAMIATHRSLFCFCCSHRALMSTAVRVPATAAGGGARGAGGRGRPRLLRSGARRARRRHHRRGGRRRRGLHAAARPGHVSIQRRARAREVLHGRRGGAFAFACACAACFLQPFMRLRLFCAAAAARRTCLQRTCPAATRSAWTAAPPRRATRRAAARQRGARLHAGAPRADNTCLLRFVATPSIFARAQVLLQPGAQVDLSGAGGDLVYEVYRDEHAHA